MELYEIAPYLKNAKRNGQGGFIAACPVCGDDHHLYVNSKNGTLLAYCQKCNAKLPEIIKALDITPKQDIPVTEIERYDHIYKNPDGSIAYYKERKKYSNGKKVFTFWYRTENGEKKYAKPDGCNNLYNLDLLEAASPSERLYIVEGEKCADACVRKGLLATTSNTGGGSKARLSDTDERLLTKFGDRVVIPDNDAVGLEYAARFPGAKILKLSDIWSDIKPKQDIADYINSGKDLDAIVNYEFPKPIEFDKLRFDDFLDTKLYKALMDIPDEYERTRAETLCREKAAVYKKTRAFNDNYKAYKRSLVTEDVYCRRTKFTGQPLSLSCGQWVCDDNGVRKNETSYQNGQKLTRYASPIPVIPSEILENIETGAEKIRLAFKKNGRWRDFICLRSEAAAVNNIIKLSDRGLEVNSENAKLLVEFIGDSVSRNLNTLPRKQSISRLGWINDKFMPYDADYVYDGENAYLDNFNAYTQKGSFEAWRDYITKLIEANGLYLRLQLAASFASVLLKQCHALSFCLHFWGGTGTGKTVGLMIAASVWGNPEKGKTWRTMNNTENAFMNAAAFLHDLPFFGDELQLILERGMSYDKLIMKLCEGIDRGRLTKNGTAQQLKTWSNCFIFTGEQPVTKANSGGGVKNRVIEIDVSEARVASKDSLAFIFDNYGTAGKRFVEEIKAETDIMAQYDVLIKQILAEVDTTEKQACAAAMLLLADRLACKYIYDNVSPLRICHIEDYLSSAAEVDISQRAYDYVINFIGRNRDNFKNIGRECWGKFDSCERFVYIDLYVLMKAMDDEKYSFDAVKKEWSKRKLLEKSNAGNYYHQTTAYSSKGKYVKLRLPEAEKT